jgi:hypothetical protein
VGTLANGAKEGAVRWTIVVEGETDGGRRTSVPLATIERPAESISATTVGLSLMESKDISQRLQSTIVSQQLQEHCEARRICRSCLARRSLKDYRARRLDTVLGAIEVQAARYLACRRCGEARTLNPLSELLPDRVTAELQHLQVSLGARMPYRKAASILREFLPPAAGANHVTVRNRVLAMGKHIGGEDAEDAAVVGLPERPAKEMVVGIDGAFVKGRQRPASHGLEIVTGCVEADGGRPRIFAVVRERDRQAELQVQALLRRYGRGPETQMRILCDGEEGMRSMVGRWFRGQEEHVLDWFHVARQLAVIEKSQLYLPHVEGFEEWRRSHWQSLNSARWKLWDGNLYGAGTALTCLWEGVNAQVMLAGAGRDGRELLRQRLAKLWKYLCANSGRLINYGRERRRGHRVSTAHVESLVNRLVNWRMCKKQQARWSARGAQMLLNVRCALLNGDLAQHTGVARKPAAMASA